MIVDSGKSDVQAAVEAVFKRLPEHYRTEIIKAEIERAVSQSDERDRESYDRVARAAVRAMFSSLDGTMRSCGKIASRGK